MRPISKITHLPAIALAASLFAATPTLAQDIVFVPGTGEVVVTSESITAPSAIRAKRDTQADMLVIADRLEDPALQDGVAGIVESVTERMMQLPVGRFIAAIESARPGTIKRDIGEDATIADLAGSDADGLGTELGKQSRIAMNMMSGLTEALAGMMPQLEALGRDLEKRVADIKANRR